MTDSLSRYHLAPALCVALACAGCPTDQPVTNDGTGDDAGGDIDMSTMRDTGVGGDLGPSDAGTDAGPTDMGGGDLGVADMGADQGAPDAGPDDMGVDMSADVGVDMNVDMGQPLPGDICATALDVTAGIVLDSETTIGYTDDYEATLDDTGCPNGQFSGPDRVYVVNPATQTTYTVTVEPQGNFNPMIYVREDCAQTECLAGTIFGSAGQNESLDFDAPAGQDTFIIVDGELLGDDSGDYRLTVTMTQ
jgi:hypothetical protein